MTNYTIRIDEEVLQLCYTDPNTGSYCEVPVSPTTTDTERQKAVNETIEDNKAFFILEENLKLDFSCNFRDDVYMDGEIKRTDYSCDRPEALTEINRLVEEFPEYTLEQLTLEPKNLIGQYGAYRPPYNANSISYYDFITPSTETLATYGCNADTYGNDLLEWYGIKHDMTTLTKSAKFVFTQRHGIYLNNTPSPLPPNRSLFYGRIHNADGTVEPWIDVYIASTIDYMREWCTEHNLTFPLPEDVTSQPLFFSIVFNENTGEMTNVKAYIRHRYDD